MKRPTWPAVRDGLLFFTGLLGVIYEAVLRRPPDYGLLPVFGAMCGLPSFLGQDRKTSKNAADDVVSPHEVDDGP